MKKPIISINDMNVKFFSKGKVLHAIRNASLDINEGETVAIVGESGSGKSVFTKTINNMLEENGIISGGNVYIDYETLSRTLTDGSALKLINDDQKMLKDIYFPILLKKKEKLLSQLNKSDKNKQWIEHATKTIDDIIACNSQSGKIDLSLYSFRCLQLTNRIRFISSIKNEIKSLKKRLSIATDPKASNQYCTKYRKLSNKINILKGKIDGSTSKGPIYHHWLKKLNNMNYELYKLTDLYNIIQQGGIAKYDPKTNDVDKSYDEAKMIQEKPTQTINKTADKISSEMNSLYGFNQATSKRIKDSNDVQEVYDIVEDHNSDLQQYVTKLTNQINELYRNLAMLVYTNAPKLTTLISWKSNAQKVYYRIRGKYISTIFQDPTTSLNPLLSVGYQIAEVIRIHNPNTSWKKANEQAITLLGKVGIPNPASRCRDLPSAYSGGMRQRVVIAIAIAANPKVLIADEPTTALDVTVQAQILRLLNDLKQEYKLTVIFITHDLGVVANIADRVAVMYAGQFVEIGNVDEIFYKPRHPYTWSLIESLPQMQQSKTGLPFIPGNPPSLSNPIIGDAFAPRSKYALAIDLEQESPLFKITDTHYVKSWLSSPQASKLFKVPENVSKLSSIVEKAKVVWKK